MGPVESQMYSKGKEKGKGVRQSDPGVGEGPAVFGCWWSWGKARGVLSWNCLKSVVLTMQLLVSEVCFTFLT